MKPYGKCQLSLPNLEQMLDHRSHRPSLARMSRGETVNVFIDLAS